MFFPTILSRYTHPSWQDKYLKNHLVEWSNSTFIPGLPCSFWLSLLLHHLCVPVFQNSCVGFCSLTPVRSLVFWWTTWFQPSLPHLKVYSLPLCNTWSRVREVLSPGPTVVLRDQLRFCLALVWLPPRREKGSLRTLNPIVRTQPHLSEK